MLYDCPLKLSRFIFKGHNIMRVKRKVKKPKTVVNTVKKRLKSDYRKAKILVAVILIGIISVIGIAILTMPMPKSLDSGDSWKEAYQRLENAKSDFRRKQQPPKPTPEQQAAQ